MEAIVSPTPEPPKSQKFTFQFPENKIIFLPKNSGSLRLGFWKQ